MNETIPKEPAEVAHFLSHSFEAFRGRLIVLMDPGRRMYGELHLPPSMTDDDVTGSVGRQSLLKGTVVSSGVPFYRPGDRVLCLPWEGLHIEHGDPSLPCSNLIPEGRELRFYKGYPTDAKHQSWISVIDQVPAILEDE